MTGLSDHPPHLPTTTRRRSAWPIRFLGFILRSFGGMVRFLLYMALFFGLMVLASYYVTGRYVKGRELLAPDLTGKSLLSAVQQLQDHRVGLLLELMQPHESVPQGHIIRQFPPPGARIKAGTPMRVVVSSGQPLITVPDLRGENRITAGIRLHELGLEVGTIAMLPDIRASGGTILQTDPPGGAGVLQGSAVNLMISSSQPATRPTMPSLYGLTPTQARELLAQYGLVLARASPAYGDGVLAGQIHNQDPPAGNEIDPSIRVTIEDEPETFDDEDLFDPYDLPAVDLWGRDRESEVPGEEGEPRPSPTPRRRFYY